MVRAAIAGKLDGVETHPDPVFGLNVPESVPGVPDGYPGPTGYLGRREAYDEQAKKLASLFKENFEKFEGQVEEEVRRRDQSRPGSQPAREKGAGFDPAPPPFRVLC